MGQDNENKVLKVYFENPEKSFTVRELSKLTKIPRSTVQKKLSFLKKEKLINNENISVNSLLFKTKKINCYLEEIVNSGLIDFLIVELNPSCIILFGSFRKGDSMNESDIDLFVESSVKKNLDLSKFERKLNHKISLFVESRIDDLNDTLFNNVINGIKLFGSFKLK